MSQTQTRRIDVDDLLIRSRQYITALRQRVYGRSDGSRPTDAELNALSCVADVDAYLVDSAADACLAAPGREQGGEADKGEQGKPGWVEGQRFKARYDGCGNGRWHVRDGEVLYQFKPNSTFEKSGNYINVDAFEAAIASGELIPAEQAKPLTPHERAIESANWSKVTTPKGREIPLTHYGRGPGCLASWSGRQVWVKEDGSLEGSILASVPSNHTPNTWPLPSGTLKRLDAYFDALEQPAEPAAGEGERADYDDPIHDATDAAHPAWWRGNNHATDVLSLAVLRAIQGGDNGAGVASEPWERARRALLATRQALIECRGVLAELIAPDMTVKAADIWHRARMADAKARDLLRPTSATAGQSQGVGK